MMKFFSVIGIVFAAATAISAVTWAVSPEYREKTSKYILECWNI